MSELPFFFLCLLTYFPWQTHLILSMKAAKLVETRDKLDSPINALLMRADLHAQFDDYQFSFDVCLLYQCWELYWQRLSKGPKQQIVRFEKDGAPGIDSYNPGIQRQLQTRKASSSSLHPGVTAMHVPDVDNLLLKHHLEICLLWHVAGMGQKKKATAILPAY